MKDRSLVAGCAALGIDDAPMATLSAYLDLLEKWNRAFNLTAVREREAMITRHLLDSLSILPALEGERFVDVGSGAGLPGVPLAICCPQRSFCLLDSNGKKTRFLFQVKTALALANMAVESARAEAYLPGQGYDGILSRAFTSLPAMVRSCGHLLASGGAFYAMKGAVPEDEMAAVTAAGYRAAVTPLAVPGLDEQRHLIILRPEASA